MAYLSDIEIAQATQMEPITAIAARAGIAEADLEPYGRYKAKVDPKILRDSTRSDGKLILVPAINPTPAGDNPAWLREQIEDASLTVRIAPSACISKGRLGREVADLESLAEAGAVAFTDDGAFVDDAHVMEAAMRRAAKLNRPVMQHAVVPTLLAGGVMRDCPVH